MKGLNGGGATMRGGALGIRAAVCGRLVGAVCDTAAVDVGGGGISEQ